MESLKGIHHVTAMAGDPQANVDFYYGILGLRLVKLTVNFDDPSTYHLYYGDALGSPGTILTFFPLGQNSRAKIGTGEVTTISFAVPKGALPFWQELLGKHSITVSATAERWNFTRMEFQDPDGIKLELVEDPTPRPLQSGLFVIGESERAGFVEIVALGHRQRGQMGPGAIHHVAWRVTNEDEQLAWRSKLAESGVGVTPVRDRKYFRSI